MKLLRACRLATLSAALAMTLLSGCADGNPAPSEAMEGFAAPKAKRSSRSFMPEAPRAEMAGMMASMSPTAPTPAADEEIPKSPAAQRKIVYNATISMVAESITSISTAITELVKVSGGYISDTDESSDPTQQKRASWTVRIPVESFEPFVQKVGKLGELQQSKINSQDVTEEYVDLEARIKNKTEEEKRLLKHLADSTGKLEEILAVEKEITRVRGEVERIEGRLRYLSNVSSLSTVTITAVEIKDYVPPVAPTFATQISRTFFESSQSMINFGKGLILAAVAIAPWLPLIIIGIAILVWLLVKIWKHRHTNLFARSAPTT